MPATLDSILASAATEWQHWGESTWDLVRKTKHIASTDDEEPFAQYVIDNYCAVAGGSPSVLDIQDDRYFWSAVGMSAIMQAAGYSKAEFPFSQRHSTFIRHFIKARNEGDATAPYWGFRIGEVGGAPKVGDLVAYARGTAMTQQKAAALFDSTSSYQSHTDVVVARRPGEIDVIGCNVLDSVTMKTLPLDAQGHVADTRHFWFAVLKRTDSIA